MLTFGIETSCDETSCSVIDGNKVLSNVVSSSVHLCADYGGVVPEIASRHHVEYIQDVADEALDKSGHTPSDMDLIAVTRGPGLCGSLLTGVSFAKAMGFALNKPVIGVNHTIAHMFANFLEYDVPGRAVQYPFVGLVISGGHTSIYLVNGPDDLKVLGMTQDDAAGEAFDKVAKFLNMGYPGGPAIEREAEKFKGKDTIKFPRSYLSKNSFDFSFSGLKTAVLYYVKGKEIDGQLKSAVSFAFQEAVFEVIRDKVTAACSAFGVRELVVGGGVACNKVLRKKLMDACAQEGIRLNIPPLEFCLDNGAMIASLGSLLSQKGRVSEKDFTADPNLEEVL